MILAHHVRSPKRSMCRIASRGDQSHSRAAQPTLLCAACDVLVQLDRLERVKTGFQVHMNSDIRIEKGEVWENWEQAQMSERGAWTGDAGALTFTSLVLDIAVDHSFMTGSPRFACLMSKTIRQLTILATIRCLLLLELGVDFLLGNPRASHSSWVAAAEVSERPHEGRLCKLRHACQR